MINSELSCKLYKYTENEFFVQAVLITARNIQLQIYKSKKPSANELHPKRLRMIIPARHPLVNFVMIPNIDWNDFILSNDQFKRNPVLQVD